MQVHGLFRVAAAVPKLVVADVQTNIERMLPLLENAESQHCDLILFPETGLTGYTCHDLFHQSTLLDSAFAGLQTIVDCSRTTFSGIIIVGLPLVVDQKVFNVAAVLCSGIILGIIPKRYLPNYKEFYDSRYFASATQTSTRTVTCFGQSVPFGTDLLFQDVNAPEMILGVEICEDFWQPIPPSSYQALSGATLLANLSASNETIGKSEYRRQLVVSQSGRCLAAYAYASSGLGESTTDVVFDGHAMIAENGVLLKESQRFSTESTLTIADVDLQRLQHERLIATSFRQGHAPEFRMITFASRPQVSSETIYREVAAHPFVPSNPATLAERCTEIFHTQVAGLSTRLSHIGIPPVAIGVSGGLDSTLALVVTCKTMDALGQPRSKIQAFTMPGFGTTQRTLQNAHILMSELGVTIREIDIRPLCFAEMLALDHSPFGIDLSQHTLDTLMTALAELPTSHRQDVVFENIQARIRTNLMMNTAFVVGTGDLSELALGWCTYNADHMSMYNPNTSIPKTLVKFLVQWAAETLFEDPVRHTLHDIAATEISPELLPINSSGEAQQSTESTVGPYELVDFFLYHFVRWGCPPEKILFLARHARFDREYSSEELRHWLRIFIKRFFQNQYKRSCLPDGPKVGSVSLSPRGDWRMPSDAVAKAWLDRLPTQD